MTNVRIEAAPAAREEARRPRKMATPVRPMMYADPHTGRRERIDPDTDWFATTHDAVRQHPEKFRVDLAPLTPLWRERRDLRAELAAIEAKLAGGIPERSAPSPRGVFGPTGRRASHLTTARTLDAAWRLK